MLYLIDTETTDLENPRLVEMAVGYVQSPEDINSVEIVHERFLPPIPISIKAMSIDNITNEDVENAQEFKGSGLYNDILAANTEDNIIIAHNASFDLSVLKNEGIDIKMRVIDTLRCCKRIFKDNLAVELSLSYLNYYLSLYKEDIPPQLNNIFGMAAHSAAKDVLTLFLMTRRLLAKYGVDELIKMSSSDPILYNIMTFGKHKGQPIKEIVAEHKGYAGWIFNNCDDQDIVYSFKCNSKKTAPGEQEKKQNNK